MGRVAWLLQLPVWEATPRPVCTRPLCGSRDAVGAPHLHRVSVAIAKGKHPVPFRTRKLSPSAPMVLRGGLRGRVGRRRTSFAEGRYHAGSGPQCLLCCRSGRVVLCASLGCVIHGWVVLPSRPWQGCHP